MSTRRNKDPHGAVMRNSIERMLAALHLPGMRAAYDECTRTAVRENLACEEFLRMLLERETETREARRIERLSVVQHLLAAKRDLVTAAAIDRLVHHSVIVELNMESYRMAAAPPFCLHRSPRITGRKKQSDAGAALFAVRVYALLAICLSLLAAVLKRHDIAWFVSTNSRF
jgi:hypothetical protein